MILADEHEQYGNWAAPLHCFLTVYGTLASRACVFSHSGN